MPRIYIGEQDRSALTQDFELVDLREAAEVELLIDATNKLWINLNGKCLLRVGKIARVKISDDRPGKRS